MRRQHKCLVRLLLLVLAVTVTVPVSATYRHFLSPDDYDADDSDVFCVPDGDVAWSLCNSLDSIDSIGPVASLEESETSGKLNVRLPTSYVPPDQTLDYDISVEVHYLQAAGTGGSSVILMDAWLNHPSYSFSPTNPQPGTFGTAAVSATWNTVAGQLGASAASIPASIMDNDLVLSLRLTPGESLTETHDFLIDKVTMSVLPSQLVSLSAAVLGEDGATVLLTGTFAPNSAASPRCSFPESSSSTAASVLSETSASCPLPAAMDHLSDKPVVEFSHNNGAQYTTDGVRVDLSRQGADGGDDTGPSKNPDDLALVLGLAGAGVAVIGIAGLIIRRNAANTSVPAATATKSDAAAATLTSLDKPRDRASPAGYTMTVASAASFHSDDTSSARQASKGKAKPPGKARSKSHGSGGKRTRPRKRASLSSNATAASTATLATSGSAVSVYGIGDDYGQS